MNGLELTGRAQSHVIDVAEAGCKMHRHVVAPFLRLRSAAAAAGFDLRPASGFRDFERQLTIWNEKWNGARPLSGADGLPVDALMLSESERIDAILRWSALPGASRHHWGTDLDLIDANAIPPGYRVRLVVEEFSTTGLFAALAQWLDIHAARFGFFRPFRGTRSGVQAEPWHFSFAPLAENARSALQPAVLLDALANAPLSGKKEVMARLEELHARFIAVIDWP